jgi:hypothetical protein
MRARLKTSTEAPEGKLVPRERMQDAAPLDARSSRAPATGGATRARVTKLPPWRLGTARTEAFYFYHNARAVRPGPKTAARLQQSHLR